MRKIFIVLFVLLTSSVFAEGKKLYENFHQSLFEEDAIALLEITDEPHCLAVASYKRETNLANIYLISSSDLEKLKALLVKLETYYSDYNYISILKDDLHIDTDKKFKFIKNEIEIDKNDDEKNIILNKYYYEYN